MELFSHRTFYNMILSGADYVINNKKELNKINVFPVADGDTGSNLAYLMEMITHETTWRDNSSEMLDRMKSACLRGSRGNSGMIFSQFIITMCNYLQKHHELKDEQFLVMCEQSVDTAYRTVAVPQEGTVLTVMRSWVAAMRRVSENSQGIQAILGNSFPEVCASLENTKYQMDILRANNVVDAGASGFVHFLRGIIEAMQGSQNVDMANMAKRMYSDALSTDYLESDPIEGNHVFTETTMPEFRYCSEFLFNVDTDLSLIKERLSDMGNSLMIVGDRGQGKIHIHTNVPEQVAEVINQNGNMVYQKIEDMQRQYESIYCPSAKIAIVVDSACDIPEEWLDRYQIHMLPLHLQLGSSTYLDKITLKPKAFYERLEHVSEQPRSSQPSMNEITMLYTQLLQNYDYVLSIHLSDQLSGTYQACCNAAIQVNPERIHVVNSRTLSGAYGLIVQRTADAVATGQSIEEVKDLLKIWIQRSEILVSVPSLKYMIRGGRVSPLQGKIAKWLNMKPIVSIDGEGKSLLYGKTWFKRSNVGRMFELARGIHIRNSIESYAILHAGSEDSIARCEAEMEAITGVKPLYTSSVSSVIGMNAGKGAVSIAMMLNNINHRKG